jgi:tetratricopeptide (TPR) repeat protein
MNPEFTAIIQKLINEQGKEAFLDKTKCKALLADYTKGEYKKESRLLLQAFEAGVQKAIDTAENITICKKQQVRLLHEDYGMDEKAAAGIVDTLALVLRGNEMNSKAKALIEKTKALFYNNKYDEAIEVLNEAIRLDPNDATVYLFRGSFYNIIGQYDAAISDLSEAIRHEPNNATVYLMRGSVFKIIGQYDTAISDFNLLGFNSPPLGAVKNRAKII